MSKPTQTRIASDAGGLRTTYEEIEVGKDLGALEWTVTDADIEKQCTFDDDWHEWYVLTSPWGGRVAPPQIQSRPPRWLLSRTYNIRGVFYKHEFEYLKPIRPNQKLVISGKIGDKWVKNDREYVRYDTFATDESGEVVSTSSRVRVVDMLKRDAPRQGTGIDSGIRPERI